MNQPFRQSGDRWYAVIAHYYERALHTDTGFTYRRLFTPQIVEIEVRAGDPFKTLAAFHEWCCNTSSAYAHKVTVLESGSEGDRNGLMMPNDAQIDWMKDALKRWGVANHAVIEGGVSMSVSTLPVMAIGGDV